MLPRTENGIEGPDIFSLNKECCQLVFMEFQLVKHRKPFKHGVKLTADQVLSANQCWLLKIRNRPPQVISAVLRIDS